jgi:hypothetical protein
MKAMLWSEKGNSRSFFAISNEKTGIISVRNGNVAMKNGNVAIDNGKVEVGDRNVAEMEEKFNSSLIKNPKVAFRSGIDLKEMFATLKYEKIKQIGSYAPL